MSVAFHPGQTLTVNDLKIVIRDTTGNMVDPYYIRYSLFDFTTGVEVLIGAPDRIPATVGVGQYYVDATVPLDANIGDWIVRWNFKEQVGSPMVQVCQDFNVVKENVTLCVTGDDHEAVLVRRLRILLRDNNPDRNYRFRQPSSEQFLQAQAQVFGYLWEEEELYEYLLFAVDLFNTAPPVTGITLTDIPDRWRSVILLSAAARACAALAMNWIADEFSVTGDQLVTVMDKDNNEHTLYVSDLFDIIYGDMIAEVEKRAREEVLKGVEELKNEDY